MRSAYTLPLILWQVFIYSICRYHQFRKIHHSLVLYETNLR